LEQFSQVVKDLFEKALVYMNKMPKIWLDYAKFVGKHCGEVSLTRPIYDRALIALPVT
jgi:pre-mRNA-splicing factor SYF1